MKRVLEVQFKKLEKNAKIPQFAHPDEDVAVDVTVIGVEYDEANDAYIYHTGLACATDVRASGFCFPRSSYYKHEYNLSNHVGIVDTKGYRGEIRIVLQHRDSLHNRCLMTAMLRWDRMNWMQKLKVGSLKKLYDQCREEFLEDPIKWAPYKVGERAFQIWFTELQPVSIKEVKKLDMNTSRGTGGFGSTGNK